MKFSPLFFSLSVFTLYRLFIFKFYKHPSIDGQFSGLHCLMHVTQSSSSQVSLNKMDVGELTLLGQESLVLSGCKLRQQKYGSPILVILKTVLIKSPTITTTYPPKTEQKKT